MQTEYELVQIYLGMETPFDATSAFTTNCSTASMVKK
jgi:hypothetical protein